MPLLLQVENDASFDWSRLGMMAIFLVVFFVVLTSRRRAMRAAGPLLSAFVWPTGRRLQLGIRLVLIGLIAILLGSAIFGDPELDDLGELAASAAVLIVACAPYIVFGPARFELHERGIIAPTIIANPGTQFIPWEDVRSYKWKSTPELRLIVHCRTAVINVRILPDQQQDADRTLSEKVAATVQAG